MASTVLVTGGAGYIGSTVANQLLLEGNQVVIADNFCKGHRSAIPQGCKVEEGSVHDGAFLDKVMQKYKPEAVFHFAAFIEAGESMKDPGLFFHNNTFGSLCLLEAMVRNKVNKIVFSSTAAVYGTPKTLPITEDAPLHPENAYGESKLLVERMLEWYHKIHNIRCARLRYFNASGNTPERGEDHHPESHLIPILFEVALGQRKKAAIFGTDYPTKDGTCVRDYVHILDLASAHLLALKALDTETKLVYNLGSGSGFSVREVVDTVRKVTGQAVPVTEEPRRPGDPATLIACSDKIRKELGWKPKYDNLEAIIFSAWNWKKDHPNGYGD